MPRSRQNSQANTFVVSTTPQWTRCPTCSGSGLNVDKPPRNLVVCIDGTSNKFGRNNTNVVKLFEAVETDSKDIEQLTFYSSGIGTRPRTVHIFQRMQWAVSDMLGMAIAWNVEEIVKDAYSWLANQYRKGDKIYLFGFSRGAYQVQILAGMIYEVGLVRNITERQIGTAYDHFVSILSHQPNAHDMAREFRSTFSRKGMRVHFIGVWDTVSSVGFGRGDINLSASSAAAHACHIRHALALDEYRVKFMPEYFLEMNSLDFHDSVNQSHTTGGVQVEASFKSNLVMAGTPKAMNTSAKLHKSRENGSGFDGALIPDRRYSRNEPADRTATDIKEVWFAGSHSDVGGRHRPGKPFHAGNVSLMWMRGEAYANGLLLKTEDVLWTGEDIDFGTTNSMSLLWKMAEIIPIPHQVSFSGSGKNAYRLHLFKPRRIIPGQKIHASIRFANTYTPKATFGSGFENILETTGPIFARGNDIWEKDVIDSITYTALIEKLKRKENTAPFYLHKLLFMLKFTEGRILTQEVSDQQKAVLTRLVATRFGLAALVAIAVCFEAMDPSELMTRLQDMFSTRLHDVLGDASESLAKFIHFSHSDWPRAVPLLRPLAKHQDLRHLILTERVIDSFLQLLDYVIGYPKLHFARVMDALSSLVERSPASIVDKLFQSSNWKSEKNRVSMMLDTNDPLHLTAVLRVIVLLIVKDRDRCRGLEQRLYEVAKKSKGPVNSLAVQALIKMSRRPQKPPMHRSRTDTPFTYISLAQDLPSGGFGIGSHNTWPGVASSPATPYLPPGTTNVSSFPMTEGNDYMFINSFFPEGHLGNHRKRFLQKLLKAADGHDKHARTSATFTLLKLCKVQNDNLRKHLLEQEMLQKFIKQLQFKDSALLAAYAITKFLAYHIFSGEIKTHPKMAGYIVNMMRLDYFDEAVGVTEGFTIFKDLLGHSELRSKILEYDITKLLKRKLGSGKPTKMRMALIYLNMFQMYGEEWLTRNLVSWGLSHLESDQWKAQKEGVAILCSLSQTSFGTEALTLVIPEIVNMILPQNDPLKKGSGAAEEGANGVAERGTGTGTVNTMAMTLAATVPNGLVPVSPAPPPPKGENHMPSSYSKPPSALLGPAFVLCIMAENETLRENIRQIPEYRRLKHLYLFGDLLGVKDTPIWRVRTPTRGDVLYVVSQMIKSVDSVEGSTNTDLILPHIRHWSRIGKLVRNGVFGAIAGPPAAVGVAALTVVGAVIRVPVVTYRKVAELIGYPFTLRRQDTIIGNLREPGLESLTTSLPATNAPSWYR